MTSAYYLSDYEEDDDLEDTPLDDTPLDDTEEVFKAEFVLWLNNQPQNLVKYWFDSGTIEQVYAQAFSQWSIETMMESLKI